MESSENIIVWFELDDWLHLDKKMEICFGSEEGTNEPRTLIQWKGWVDNPLSGQQQYERVRMYIC